MAQGNKNADELYTEWLTAIPESIGYNLVKYICETYR